MKGLKKVALASAIAAVSAGAQAELKALDDSAMGELTGQAGLTIDLETQYTIGEFAYEDAGFVVLQGLALGGNTNENGTSGSIAPGGLLDNIRMTIDVAGDGTTTDLNGRADNVLESGFSVVRSLAGAHALAGNGDTRFGAAYSGTSDTVNTYGTNTTLAIDNQKTYGDGDLVIHFGFTDAWQKGGGLAAFQVGSGTSRDGSSTGLSMDTLSWDDAKEIALHAVDFQFDIDGIGLAASNYTVGTQGVEKTNHATGTDTNTDTTMLLSDISFKGYLGPQTLHIENNGNGFSGGALPGSGDADSKIYWDTFVNVTDLDLYIDIAGVQLSDIKINNSRGDLSQIDETKDSFGFAQSNRTIYAVKDAVIGIDSNGDTGFVDGIALNTDFKGDIEVGAISFGDTGVSIGSLYLTDIRSTTNWTISAH